MTREEITTFYAGRVEAMNRHDAAVLVRQHTEDGVVDSPLSNGVARGHDAIERVYLSFFRAFPDVRLRQDSLLIDGPHAVQLVTLTGTDSGGLMGESPSGRPFTMSMVLLDVLREGRIVRERRIYDFTGLLVQIGALKAKPAR
jgi:predicted ester cyclase